MFTSSVSFPSFLIAKTNQILLSHTLSSCAGMVVLTQNINFEKHSLAGNHCFFFKNMWVLYNMHPKTTHLSCMCTNKMKFSLCEFIWILSVGYDALILIIISSWNRSRFMSLFHIRHSHAYTLERDHTIFSIPIASRLWYCCIEIHHKI